MAIASRVPRKQWQALYRRVGAYEKVRQYAGTNASDTAVLRKGLTGDKQCHAWHWRESSAKCGERRVKIFDGVEANGRLGINDVVDQQWPRTHGVLYPRQRPRPPLRIPAKNVDQDIRIDQGHGIIRRGSSP